MLDYSFITKKKNASRFILLPFISLKNNYEKRESTDYDKKLINMNAEEYARKFL